MKRTLINLLFVLFIIPVDTEAKIWRVNNNADVVSDFTSLSDAMLAYASGDTIHLEPSLVGYTVTDNFFFTANRFVTIIGNGYLFATTTDNPLDPDIRKSMISPTPYAKIGVNADIKFIGICFAGMVTLKKISGPKYVSNVSFESCLFIGGIEYSDGAVAGADQIDGLHFSKNNFFSMVSINLSANPANLLYNFTVENNIFYYSFIIDPVPTNHDVIIIRNNIFKTDCACYQAYWANNIFTSITPPAVSGFDGSTLKNNLFACPSFVTNASTSVSNQFDINMSAVFISNPGDSPDNFYVLAPGSVAIGAGVPNGLDPVDCGAYGGPNPYKPNGMPAIPSISELNVAPSVMEGNNIHIGVKSVSNN